MSADGVGSLERLTSGHRSASRFAVIVVHANDVLKSAVSGDLRNCRDVIHNSHRTTSRHSRGAPASRRCSSTEM